MIRTIAFSFLLFLSTTRLFAQAGVLDSTFGNNGVASTHIYYSYYSVGISSAIQSDGKILVGAWTDYPGPLSSSCDIVRYTPDGNLDIAFGDSGVAGFGSFLCSGVTSIALQPDDQIIYVGRENITNVILFGGDTMVSLEGAALRIVNIQQDGKVVVSGTVSDGQNNFGMLRFNKDASFDLNFGIAGKVSTIIGEGHSESFSAFIQPDGKIVLGGESESDSNRCFTLARYNINGNLDSTFGTGGIVQTHVGVNSDWLRTLALQSDGKIVAAGYTQQSPDSDWDSDIALVRYNSNGSLDTTFGIGGLVTTDFGTGFGAIYSIVIQEDGKILAGGSFDGIDQICRFDSIGSLDSSFGIGGKVTNVVGVYLNIQQDGKIIVAGRVENSLAVARYLSGLNVGIINFSIANLPVLIYPNPIHSQATLIYTLSTEDDISIALYDMLGCMVQSFIINQRKAPGEHNELLQYDPLLPAGNYILSISNGMHSQGVKITRVN